MNRLIGIRMINSGGRNINNPFLRNPLSNATTSRSSPSPKSQNPSTCGCGCGCSGAHPLFSVENPKYKTPNPHTQNPEIPNPQENRSVWKMKPRLKSRPRKMFPKILVINNNTKKSPFEGPFVGLLGLSVSIVTLSTGAHFVYEYREKEKQNQQMKNISQKLDLVLEKVSGPLGSDVGVGHDDDVAVMKIDGVEKAVGVEDGVGSTVEAVVKGVGAELESEGAGAEVEGKEDDN